MERPSELRAHLALLFMVVVWAVNFSVAKVALKELTPLSFNALRFPLAAALLVVILRARGGIPLPTRAELPRVLALGLLGNLLYQMCFIFGLDRTRAGNAILLLAGTPIITAVLSSMLGHERIRPPSSATDRAARSEGAQAQAAESCRGSEDRCLPARRRRGSCGARCPW